MSSNSELGTRRRWLAALDGALFPAAPPLRLAALRVLVTGFGLLWLLGLAPLMVANLSFPAERFTPVGVISVLERPLPLALALGIWAGSVAAAFAALLGWHYRASSLLYAFGLLVVTSYRNSWGMIFHTENLLVLHSLVLAFLPAADAWSLDARGRSMPGQPHPRYGWGPRLMATITVLAYVLAGVAKLRTAGSGWLDGEVLLSHVAWDNLRKIELGDRHSPIGAALCAYPVIFAPLAWMSVGFELGAPLALLGRRLAKVWALSMWAFHVGVLLMMAIAFLYPLSGVAYACLFELEGPLLRWSLRVHTRRPEGLLARLLPEVSCPSG